MAKFLYASVSLIAFMTGTGAWAQSQTPAPPKQSPEVAAPAEGGTTIQDIVVTAARRAENAQRAALSIQALSSEALARANFTRVEDLNAVAPGVSISTAGAYPLIYVRGVGNYGTQAYSEGAVAFNLDGVYVSRSWATRGMFYDLDRVEVLKGPQGTLYGRNASGGAINVITARPKLGSVNGFAEVEAGNFDLIQGTAAVNVPLNDKLALRASGQVVSRSGYLTDGYEDQKTQSGRLQLLFEPTTDFSLLLNANYQHAGGKGSGPVLVYPKLPGDPWRGGTDPSVIAIMRAQPGIGPILSVPAKDGFLDTDVYAVGAEMNWNLGFAKLTLIPAYRDGKLNNRSYAPSFLSENHEHDKQTSAEARLGNESDKLKWVAGLYFFNENQSSIDNNPLQRVVQGVNASRTGKFDSQTRSYAAFGQATYSLSDQFRLTGGLRYTNERKEISGGFSSLTRPAAPPAAPCLPDRVFDTQTEPPFFCRQDVALTGRQEYNSVTYKAGVEYDLTPHSLAYANVSTGFKSGGFYSAPPPNTFRPEKVSAIEGGVKNRFFDNRLQVNIEAFYWRYRDHQESHIGPTSLPGFFTFLTENAGRAKSYGVDLDVVYLPTANDELGFKVEFNESKYDSFVYTYPTANFGPPVAACAVGPLTNGRQIVDCSGKRLIHAPLWSGTADYSHSFDLGSGRLTATIGVQFASTSFLAIDFIEAERQKAYALADFDLTYKPLGQRWAISAFVHNIANSAVLTTIAKSPFVNGADPLAGPQGLVVGALRAPRTFGGRIRLNF